MTKQAQYLIKIDLDRIEAVQLLLAHSAVRMDPVDDMVCISPENLLDGIILGRDAQEAIAGVNSYLELETEEKPSRIDMPFQEMSPEARRDFLALVNIHSSWDNDRASMFLTYMAPVEWRRFADQHLREHPDDSPNS